MAEFAASIDIDAEPATVFEYLTTAAGMTAWMGQHADLDARPGGRFAVDIAGHAIRGSYLHVEPHTRVVVSWGVAGSEDLPAGASTVEFRLSPIATGTRLELTHSGLPEPRLPGHADGWGHFLPRMAAAARGESWEDRWMPLPDRVAASLSKEMGS